MANYYCAVRTNYFHVKDAEKFKEFMSHVQGCEDDVNVFEQQDENGNTIFGFGCYNNILGYVKNYDEEDDIDNDDAYNAFIKGLQEHIVENDAILMLEAGHEKLRYIVGIVTVITVSDCRSRDIRSVGINLAAEMLKNPDYYTRAEY